ncbi:hypothetical protein GH714_037413 [Hevea brasiliensis]|uniref:Core domain-containing protein n=1 Tax=Hevea brasiliensis TaxID=3981 RepID=A0A6A6KWU9_HEVBR|nr:hypothetical protein GH714_037413 [Hevea brasiliensis]
MKHRVVKPHRANRGKAVPATEGIAPAISLTDNALKHLNKMRKERDEDLCLRIGVKQGGCSGMSYTMEFENRANARPDDSIIEYNGFVIGYMVLALVLHLQVPNAYTIFTLLTFPIPISMLESFEIAL